VIVGAGIGGLAAALVLARHGYQVDILEKATSAGGKLRQVALAGRLLDAGPTVFTMRWVFDTLFEAAGASFDEHVTVRPMQLLARHAWREDAVLDLHADPQQSAAAIGEFAGADDARGFLDFSRRAQRIYQALEGPFIGRASPSLPGLVGHHLSRGWPGLEDLMAISPFATLSRELTTHFRDPRLQQLFGRYATYCGSSPFAAPATLMLIAHVEQLGVWDVEGGMAALTTAMESLAVASGVQIHYGACATSIHVVADRAQGVLFQHEGRQDSLAADAVFCNADANALGSGSLGTDAMMAQRPTPVFARSLSALTWNMVARTGGFPMHRHNVFFSNAYQQEFIDIFERHRLPAAPTVYVCAQDRGDDCAAVGETERLLVLVNAPPIGDTHEFSSAEVEACRQSTISLLDRCGLSIDWSSATIQAATPNDWNRMFPTTGGALYGRASHGWRAAFQRPGVRSRIANLYQTGGSVHPGPGVAMAALSGQQAATACMEDHHLIPRSRRADTRGGMSTQ
jgi:1-hydroxycarotenoid 3,4-desaturase